MTSKAPATCLPVLAKVLRRMVETAIRKTIAQDDRIATGFSLSPDELQDVEFDNEFWTANDDCNREYGMLVERPHSQRQLIRFIEAHATDLHRDHGIVIDLFRDRVWIELIALTAKEPKQ